MCAGIDSSVSKIDVGVGQLIVDVGAYADFSDLRSEIGEGLLSRTIASGDGWRPFSPILPAIEEPFEAIDRRLPPLCYDAVSLVVLRPQLYRRSVLSASLLNWPVIGMIRTRVKSQPRLS